MAKKPEITPIDTSFNVVGSINQNFENIKEAFENTLSLDGSTPNAMRSDLDLNSNDLLNVRRVEAKDLVLSGGSLLGFVEEAEQSANVAVAAKDDAVLAKEAAEEARRAADDLTGHLMGGGAGQLLRKNSNADYDYGWQTISGTGDMVESVYDPQGIREDAFNMDFMVDGTSRVAMTMAERTAVEGSVRHDTAQSLTTGQRQQARDNIGLGSVATENVVPLSKGGLGATTAEGARSTIGAGVPVFLGAISNFNAGAGVVLTNPSSSRPLFVDMHALAAAQGWIEIHTRSPSGGWALISRGWASAHASTSGIVPPGWHYKMEGTATAEVRTMY